LSGTQPTDFLQENQKRTTQAVSAFMSNRMHLSERLAATPIVRIEHIRNDRIFYADNNSSNADSGRIPANFTEVIPGIGVTYKLHENTVIYGGVHRGFSPPRVEDAISGTGTVVDLRADRSINAELGIRSSLSERISIDATAFRNDFSNLVQVGSIAGGSSSYQEGKALFQGVELAGQFDRLTQLFEGNLFARFAWTWLPTAEQKSAFRSGSTSDPVVGSVGNRLPYAPENLLNLTLGYRAPANWSTRLDYVYVGEQFSDFANITDVDSSTLTATQKGSGQFGKINAYGILNAVANYTVGKTTFFIAGKNLSDKTYIVDRTRGIQVGMPRTVQIGMKYAF
jgi:Fe(3+) dicitrate transport protein